MQSAHATPPAHTTDRGQPDNEEEGKEGNGWLEAIGELLLEMRILDTWYVSGANIYVRYAAVGGQKKKIVTIDTKNDPMEEPQASCLLTSTRKNRKQRYRGLNCKPLLNCIVRLFQVPRQLNHLKFKEFVPKSVEQ